MSLDDDRDLVEEARDPTTFEAVVLATPGSESTGLTVRIPAFDGFQGRTVFGPMPWQPRYEAGNDIVTIVYPQAGDRALVVFSDDGSAWAVAYWPFD